MTSNLILRLYYLLASMVFHARSAAAKLCTAACGKGYTCDSNTGTCVEAGTSSVKTTIQLMEPIGNCDKLTIQPGFGLFYKYFNLLWPYLIGSAAGIAVLMAVVGGLQIIMSGGDQGKRQEGIDRFKNAIMGLLMALFAGLILRTLNPSFYVSGNISTSGGC